MNLKIKFRESFRPFAPIALREKASEYFGLMPEEESPYMLIVAPVNEDMRLETRSDRVGIDRAKDVRSTIAAVTHVDDSARIQTVDAERSPRLHALLSAFEERTGCPVLINTSFNIRGEPIVLSAEGAYRCFMATDMDALAILLKEDQPALNQGERTAYLARFGDD